MLLFWFLSFLVSLHFDAKRSIALIRTNATMKNLYCSVSDTFMLHGIMPTCITRLGVTGLPLHVQSKTWLSLSGASSLCAHPMIHIVAFLSEHNHTYCHTLLGDIQARRLDSLVWIVAFGNTRLDAVMIGWGNHHSFGWSQLGKICFLGTDPSIYMSVVRLLRMDYPIV